MRGKATPRQIEHIKQHIELFHAHQVNVPPYNPNAVDEYFHEYSHLPDLYLDLCNDLDLQPIDVEPV